MNVEISEIKIGKRHRKDLGDIPALAASIEAIGLLHPVVIQADKTLVVGERRIAAFKHLGRTTITANVAKNLSELSMLLRAESDENTCRKAFNPVEAVAIGEAIEKAYKPVAAEKKSESHSRAGKASGQRRKTNAGANCPSVKPKRDESARTTAVAAAAVGMARRSYEKAKTVVHSGNAVAVKQMATTGKVNRAYKQVNVERATKVTPPPLPQGTFDLILADPPWKYDFAETENREIENQYPTLCVAELCRLKPPAADKCALFLWATAPKLREALQVIDGWGFEYKTHAVWDKQKIGMGYWFRGQHELLLVASKGGMSPPGETLRKPSLFSAPRGKHSQKPDCVYKMLEAMFPKATRCEMFARNTRDNWSSWGNQVKE